jgi:hypothetical protein
VALEVDGLTAPSLLCSGERVRAWWFLVVVVQACQSAQVADSQTCPSSVEGPAQTLEVPVGQRQRLAVIFRNTSRSPVFIASPVIRGDSSFTLVATTAPQVVPAGSCDNPGLLEVPLVFAPTVGGPVIAQFNGTLGQAAFSVTLRGTGLGPRLDVDERLSLGLVAVGEQTPRTLSLRNGGSAGSSLDVEVVRIAPGDSNSSADELCVGQWTGSRCENARVTVNRQAELPLVVRSTSPGPREWVLTLKSSAFGSPEQQVRLSAFVVDTRGCALAPSEPVLEFSPPTDARTLRLENRGTTDCLLQSVMTTNPTFRVSAAPALPARVVPGQTVELSLVGRLVNLDVPLEGDLVGRLLGEAPAPLVVPLRFKVGPVPTCMKFGSEELDLGEWPLGCQATRSWLIARNGCTTPVLIRGVRVLGGFVRTSPFSPTLVPPDERLVVEAEPVPAGTGSVAGLVEVLGAGGTATASLRGRWLEPPLRTDTFSLDVAPATDLLFILDESPSFASHHPRTATALAEFAWRLSYEFADTRVGVTGATRTPGAGRLRQLPSGARWTAQRDATFRTDLGVLATMRDGGSESQSCLEAALRARTTPLVEEPSGTQGFWRPGARQAVICVTDADEQTEELDAGIIALGTTTDGGAFTYSVVSGRAMSACAVESAGSRHAPVVRAFQGLEADVCERGWWGAFFDTPLPQPPRTQFRLWDDVLGTPTVTLDGAPLPSRAADGGVLWRVSGSSFFIHPSLVDGTARTLSVTYATRCR